MVWFQWMATFFCLAAAVVYSIYAMASNQTGGCCPKGCKRAERHKDRMELETLGLPVSRRG